MKFIDFNDSMHILLTLFFKGKKTVKAAMVTKLPGQNDNF